MIKSLYEIGKVLKKEFPEYFKPWGNPFPNQEAKVIVANIRNGKLQTDLEIEDFKDNYVDKYLYRKVQGVYCTTFFGK